VVRGIAGWATVRLCLASSYFQICLYEAVGWHVVYLWHCRCTIMAELLCDLPFSVAGVIFTVTVVVANWSCYYPLYDTGG